METVQEQKVLGEGKVEDEEQHYEKDRNTPDLVSEHFVRFVGLGHLKFVVGFTF